MDGYIQEIKNLAHMEFIQYWRETKDCIPESEKEYLKNLYCAAFVSGAIASQKLTVMGFDRIKEKFQTND